ncbi:hypothetical protein [Streptacidiphilus melanogenes]|uniref:hypothetical protein n=1 Tax=Streptacidiphilus melanogenes TaxID=411235 RepID=UPI0005A8AC6B|nr:hypothetical protein [Streptacidiphilus melanogenes]
MTTQTQMSTAPSVDEAFWELVWSNPDLLAADLQDLTQDDPLPPPPDHTPPSDGPAEAPRPPGPQVPDVSARRRPRPRSRLVPAAARGMVRSPPAPSNHSC